MAYGEVNGWKLRTDCVYACEINLDSGLAYVLKLLGQVPLSGLILIMMPYAV